jgi:hypothetical protein
MVISRSKAIYIILFLISLMSFLLVFRSANPLAEDDKKIVPERSDLRVWRSEDELTEDEKKEDDNSIVIEKANLPKNNVRVLDNFNQKNFSGFNNIKDFYRSAYVLAARIAEYLTKEEMPHNQPPGDSNIPPPVYDIFPIAWSIKIVNIKHAFLPQLREEVVVLVQYTPQYFKDNAFHDGTWVLASLTNKSRTDNTDPLDKRIFPYDSVSLWNISSSPVLINPEKPASSKLENRPNIRNYKERPTIEQIIDFIQSMDFGNNDIFAYQSEKYLMNIEVLQIFVYPDYAKLASVLAKGLPPEELVKRAPAYKERDRRDSIRPYIP